MKTIDCDNIRYKIGQNASENWKILDESNKDDVFFHLKSFPSCYVIMDSRIENIPAIKFGAFLCKQNTKYKSHKNIKIDYCKVSNVSKTNKLGEVIYNSNRQVNTIKL